MSKIPQDIHTPINVILEMSELLLLGDLTEDQKRFVHDINVSACALQKTVSQPDVNFWKSIESIKELSVDTGLGWVSGNKEIYEKSLSLITMEIVKCRKNLIRFLELGDMHGFNIEAHSIKGSLLNIGAKELSSQALELELAAEKEDKDFCLQNLSPFLEDLETFNIKLKEAFMQKIDNSEDTGELVIPDGLETILNKLLDALKESNYVKIDNAKEKLDALNTKGALKQEIEKIKDAVLVMDTNAVEEIIQKLLKKN